MYSVEPAGIPKAAFNAQGMAPMRCASRLLTRPTPDRLGDFSASVMRRDAGVAPTLPACGVASVSSSPPPPPSGPRDVRLTYGYTLGGLAIASAAMLGGSLVLGSGMSLLGGAAMALGGFSYANLALSTQGKNLSWVAGCVGTGLMAAPLAAVLPWSALAAGGLLTAAWSTGAVGIASLLPNHVLMSLRGPLSMGLAGVCLAGLAAVCLPQAWVLTQALDGVLIGGGLAVMTGRLMLKHARLCEEAGKPGFDAQRHAAHLLLDTWSIFIRLAILAAQKKARK